MKLVQFVLVFAMASAAFAVENKFGCNEIKKASGDGVVRGFILEEGIATSENNKRTLQVSRLGKGILSSHGDGTASDDELLVDDSGVLKPNYAHSADSAKWKYAEPFVLPVDAEGTYILYVQPSAYSTIKEDFEVRLKVTKDGKEKNYTLSCNHV